MKFVKPHSTVKVIMTAYAALSTIVFGFELSEILFRVTMVDGLVSRMDLLRLMLRATDVIPSMQIL